MIKINIIDYGILIILILCALKGFKNGLLPTLINFIGIFLIFIIAFYLKNPISIYLYNNLPFISFNGLFKGVTALNILFYEMISYGLTFTILSIIFCILKRIAIIINKGINATIILSLPNKLIGAIIGILEGIIYSFIILSICTVISTTTKYVNNSKYSNIILTKIPIINNVTNNLTTSAKDIYNTVLKNKNNKEIANLETIDILMKNDIISYDSIKKLINDKKLNINNIDNIIERYKND